MTKPLWVALLLAAGLVHARPAKPPAMEHATLTEGFLAAHPDLRWRLEGVRFYEKEDYPAAMRSFLRAAGFADKPSQAIIAEMHWKGVGTPGIGRWPTHGWTSPRSGCIRIWWRTAKRTGRR